MLVEAKARAWQGQVQEVPLAEDLQAPEGRQVHLQGPRLRPGRPRPDPGEEEIRDRELGPKFIWLQNRSCYVVASLSLFCLPGQMAVMTHSTRVSIAEMKRSSAVCSASGPPAPPGP